LPNEIASKNPKTLSETSFGKRENGSTRMIWESDSDKWDSWEKQHMVRIPSRMILRLGCGEEEKVDQREVIAARSERGRASRDCASVGEQSEMGERDERGRENSNQSAQVGL
jgi:hypothetical protein